MISGRVRIARIGFTIAFEIPSTAEPITYAAQPWMSTPEKSPFATQSASALNAQASARVTPNPSRIQLVRCEDLVARRRVDRDARAPVAEVHGRDRLDVLAARRHVVRRLHLADEAVVVADPDVD